MPAIKNPKHELFVQNVAKGMSGAKAYVAAGYQANPNSANVAATRLLQQPNIAARLNELLERRDNIEVRAIEKAVEKTALSKTWIIERLMRNAMMALGEQKVKISKLDKETNTTIDVELVERDPAAANKALELLGKTLGIFIDRKEVGGPGDFANMTTDELRDILARDMATLGLRLSGAEDQGRSRAPGGQLN